MDQRLPHGQPMDEFLDHKALESSDVVANSRMNRERVARGVNSYERELGLDPIDFLQRRLSSHGRAAWLDLCCGQGKALAEAAGFFAGKGEPFPSLHGIDLVGMFSELAGDWPFLQLEIASLHSWSPPAEFELITCVHGLHYLGDKLGAICRTAGWLTENGLLVANLDLENFRDDAGQPMGGALTAWFRSAGLDWNGRQHLLSCHGNRKIDHPFEYVGAQDTAGPNYTGQEVIDSFYWSC